MLVKKLSQNALSPIEVTPSDIVIVFIHWGEEYTANITKEQRALGERLIDAGASIVIGSHSHVLQPVEYYQNGIIFYGVGNFVFDQGWSRTKDSCLLRYCLDTAGKGVFEVVPLRIENGAPAETRNSIFTNRIFHTLTKNLTPENYELENNRLYIYPPQLTT